MTNHDIPPFVVTELLALRAENEQLKAQLAAIKAHHEDVQKLFEPQPGIMDHHRRSLYLYHRERAESATLKPEQL